MSLFVAALALPLVSAWAAPARLGTDTLVYPGGQDATPAGLSKAKPTLKDDAKAHAIDGSAIDPAVLAVAQAEAQKAKDAQAAERAYAEYQMLFPNEPLGDNPRARAIIAATTLNPNGALAPPPVAPVQQSSGGSFPQLNVPPISATPTATIPPAAPAASAATTPAAPGAGAPVQATNPPPYPAPVQNTYDQPAANTPAPASLPAYSNSKPEPETNATPPPTLDTNTTGGWGN